MRILWGSWRLWPVPAHSLCTFYPTPAKFVLRCCSNHIPSSSCFLRCCHCHQVLWRLYQVRNDQERLRGNNSCRSFTSYLIIIKSLMPNVVTSIFHNLTSPDTNPPEWALSSRNWLILVMLLLAPLSFLRKLDSLRHTSYIAMFSVGGSPR